MMRNHAGYCFLAALVLAVAGVALGSSCSKAYGKEPNWDDWECRTFYYCEDYSGSVVHCPHGFQFHYEHKECLKDEDVFCKWQIDYYSSDRWSSSSSSDHSDHEEHHDDHSSSSSSHECHHEHGKEPDYHAEHCETYYECDHHHGTLKHCPSGHQFHWHDMECYEDDFVHCQDQRKTGDHDHHSHDDSHHDTGSDDTWLYHMLASMHGNGINNGGLGNGMGNMGGGDGGIAEALAAAALLRPGGVLGIQGNVLPNQGNVLPFGAGVQPFQGNQGFNPIPINQNPNQFIPGGIGFAGNPVQVNPALNLGPNVNQIQAAGGQGFGVANQGQNAVVGGNPNFLGLGANPFGVGRDATEAGVGAVSVAVDNPDQVLAVLPDPRALTPQQDNLARGISTFNVVPAAAAAAAAANARFLPPLVPPPGVGNAGQVNLPLPFPATNNLNPAADLNNNNIAVSINNEQGLAVNAGQAPNGRAQIPAVVAAGIPAQGAFAVNAVPAPGPINVANAGTRLARPRMAIQGTAPQPAGRNARVPNIAAAVAAGIPAQGAFAVNAVPAPGPINVANAGTGLARPRMAIQGTAPQAAGRNARVPNIAAAQGTQPVAQITVSLQGQGTQPLPAAPQGALPAVARVPVPVQGQVGGGTLPLPIARGTASGGWGQEGSQSRGLNAVPVNGAIAVQPALPRPLPPARAEGGTGGSIFIPSLGLDVPVVDQRWSAASSSEATNKNKSAASAAFSQSFGSLPVAVDGGIVAQNVRAVPNAVDAGNVKVPLPALLPDAPEVPAANTKPGDWVLLTQATTPGK